MKQRFFVVNHPLKIAKVFTLGLLNFDDSTSLIQFLQKGWFQNDLFLVSSHIFSDFLTPLACTSVAFGVSNKRFENMIQAIAPTVLLFCFVTEEILHVYIPNGWLDAYEDSITAVSDQEN